MNFRRLALGLATLAGRPRGFFIPYRYAGSVPPPNCLPPYAAMEALFRANEDRFRQVLAAIDSFAAPLQAIGEGPPPSPRWRQDWFPRLDAAAAYALVRQLRPKRIVEVGSGHSTRFLARAVLDGGLETEIACIDPAPRASLAGLPVQLDLTRATLQEAGSSRFAQLATGDILLVDSSHILMPGTDVDILLNRVVPTLPAGVYVHLHDMFLPDDYPAEWAWRGYNEQLGAAALLTGGSFELVFSSHYVSTRMGEDLATTVIGRLPLVPGARETSLWFRKLAAPVE